jgi:hypothetical protein
MIDYFMEKTLNIEERAQKLYSLICEDEFKFLQSKPFKYGLGITSGISGLAVGIMNKDITYGVLTSFGTCWVGFSLGLHMENIRKDLVPYTSGRKYLSDLDSNSKDLVWEEVSSLKKKNNYRRAFEDRLRIGF